jgi:uncharacterized protein YkwD
VRRLSVGWAALVLILGGSSVAEFVRPERSATKGFPAVRYGPERAETPYDDKFSAAKVAVFERINADRVAASAPPLTYDLFAAKVADAFCADSAQSGSLGHWDLRGRSPYLRWAADGGVDYSAENFVARTRIPGVIRDTMESLLRGAHNEFMKERPPQDGHRKTILDPMYTHVGIGAAVKGGEFRMTEEFSRHVMEWVEVPAGPMPRGTVARFRARPLPGWSVGPVEIAYEPPQPSLTLLQLAMRGAYGFPPAVRSFLPSPGPGQKWSNGDTGDFTVEKTGILDLAVPLSSGPGNYYVMVFVGRGSIQGKTLNPATAARIVAN